jgi:hypothetical protein
VSGTKCYLCLGPLIFGSRENQVEGLSVSRSDTYGVDLAVRKYHFQQSGKTKTPSKKETGLDASHNACVSLEGREKNFFLTSSFIG